MFDFRLPLIAAALAASAAQPGHAATFSESEFVTARTKVASAAYIRTDPVTGAETVVVGETRTGVTGEPVSADITPSPADILGVNVGGIAPRIPPGALATSDTLGFTAAIVGGELNASTEPAFHILRATVSEDVEMSISPSLLAAGADLYCSFILTDMFVEIWDNSGDPFARMSGSLDYDIFVDGERVWGFGASLFGRRDSPFAYSAETSNFLADILGMPVDSVRSGDPGTAPRRLDVAPLEVTDLLLGTFSEIDILPVVTVIMTAEIELEPFVLGAGARAGIGDPSAPSVGFGSFTLETLGDTPPPVPLPAAGWLLLGGLALLGARRPAR